MSIDYALLNKTTLSTYRLYCEIDAQSIRIERFPESNISNIPVRCTK